MAKRKPVRRRLPDRAQQDLRHLLPLAAVTLLLLFGAFALWQTWIISRESGAVAHLRDVQRRAASALTTEVGQLHKQVDSALADPQLVAALQSGDAAGRAAATTRAYALLPRAQAVAFFSPTLSEVINADYQTFGYARAAQLMMAQSNGGRSGIRTVMDHGKRMLTFAQAVTTGGRTVAYAWVELPFATLQQTFEDVPVASGRLELRQENGLGDVVLIATGSRTAMDELAPLQVPGSQFSVVAIKPNAFIVLPRPWPFALALALLALAAAGALVWRRRRPDAHASIHDKEPTLQEMTRREAASTDTAPAPAPAPAAAAPAAQAAPTAPAAPPPQVAVDRHMFRAYDIRGVVGRSLDADVARLIGQAIGSVMADKGLAEIVVGRDGRLSGPELAAALAEGLRAAGIDVIDIGAAPTPVVYFAAFHFNTGSGVAVTGSHNPPDYNGFKIVVGGETLSEQAIQDLYERIAEGRLVTGETGALRKVDILDDYIERIAGDVQAERPLKVVADAGNGIAGAVAPKLLEAIGCEVVPLYCEVDGNFPNHHPDPSDPHNLQDLILAVQKTHADLGLAFDGDGDRLGVVTRDGEVIYPDRLLMLFARDVLSRQPGATIIFDVKCTGHLQPEILYAGGSPLMWRTGHSLIKAKMRETGAALAGEMSGHFFFGERWYGFDDGLYAAARLLEILAGDIEGRSAEAIFETLPKGVSTPELKIEMEEGEHYAFIERFKQQASFGEARLTTIDGVRADWSDGWGLIRPSNTTPVLVLRFDADNAEALKRIQGVFRRQILAVDPDLKLPF